MSELALLGVGDAFTVRVERPLSVFPSSAKPAQTSAELLPVELGCRFYSDVPAEVRAVRFYKAPANAGPHTVSLWDDSGALLGQAQAAAGSETASGWQEVALSPAVIIAAGRFYRASYHAPGACSYDPKYFTGPRANGPLHIVDSVFVYGAAPAFPTQSNHGNYWVDVLAWPGLPGASASPALNPGKLLSVGAEGLVRFGFNQHAWSYRPAWYRSLGAKAMRIGGASFPRYSAWGYPGPAWTQANQNYNRVVQDAISAAVADGLDVVLAIDSGFPNAPDATNWPAFWTAVAQANVANAEHVVLELGNEPNFNLYSAAAYAVLLKAFAQAVRAVSPKFRIGGPTINASYVGNAQRFVRELMAIPGISSCFDVGTFHPYYQTPENCFNVDIRAFIARMDTPAQAAGRTDLEYVADEAGYSNADGWMRSVGLDPALENRASTGWTTQQGMEPAADYYSRLIPLMRGASKLRMVTFYALKDEGAAADPTGMNGQAHFGVLDEWGNPTKPAARVCADMLPYMHAADAAWLYTREGQAGAESETADYFLKLRSGSTNTLVAWTVGEPRPVSVVVQAPQPCALSWNVAANAKTARQIDVGSSLLRIPLARRSVIVSASGPIDFPEFPVP